MVEVLITMTRKQEKGEVETLLQLSPLENVCLGQCAVLHNFQGPDYNQC